mmetsp:Transcript_22281/g.75330  ORF Transcript_22281/g.75330 Transcript_22281/m.75330 type:complete len:367 (-) Transcript_22281:539-1639(-)
MPRRRRGPRVLKRAPRSGTSAAAGLTRALLVRRLARALLVRAAEAPGRQRDELLGSRRVDRDARVEVGLCRAHLHGHAKALEHLVGGHADDVEPNNLFLLAEADDLHRRLGLRRRLDGHRAVPEVDKRRLVDLDVLVAVLGARLGLGQADDADRRVREDDGRDERVVRLGRRLAVEEAVSQAPASRNGHGRQLDEPAHVAQRVHARLRRVLVLVDNDVALAVRRDLGVLERERLGQRVAANREQHRLVASDFLVAGVDDLEARIFVEDDLGQRRVRHDGHALALHLRVEHARDHVVKVAQRAVAADDERRRCAEGVEDAGHLDGDVPRADNGRRLWQHLELEETVGRDAVLGALERRHGRLAANGD